MSENSMKTPIPVYAASCMILLTSVVYYLFFRKLEILPTYSLVLMALAGASILIRHKLAWIVGAALSLLFVASISFYIYREQLNFDENPNSLLTLYILCSVSVYTVAMVFMYYRYPYMDQRQRFFASTAHRYQVSVPVIFPEIGSLEASTVDISYGGFKILSPTNITFEVGQKTLATLPKWKIEPIKVKMIRKQSEHLIFEILGLSRDEQNELKYYLNKVSSK